MQHYLGLDIGTTSISIVVLDITTGKTLLSITEPHKSRIPNDDTDSYLLDPAKVFSITQKLVDSATGQFPNIEGIGATGQMHGVLIVDQEGNAVSPVYTWLDMRASRLGPNGVSYISDLEKLTGVAMPSGYGCSTLYTLSRCGTIPSGSETFCTITDYVAMHLAGRNTPMLDPSLAHSVGYFDVNENSFKYDLWQEVSSLSLPSIVESATIIGRYKNRIPITAAIGDNQASFLGSVKKSDSGILINVGTSGQICFLETSDQSYSDPNLDIRPYPTGEKLLVGASLTGGKSFDVLAGLIEDLSHLIKAPINPYDILDTFVMPPVASDTLSVETTFKGTRLDPLKTGSISGISLDNFTIERLYWTFAEGIIDELYGMIGQNHEILRKPDLYIVASGNAVKKNLSLVMEIKKHFHAPVLVPLQEESAAQGAALIAAAGIQGGLSVLPELTARVITYQTPDFG